MSYVSPRVEGGRESPPTTTHRGETGRFVVSNFRDGYKKGYKIDPSAPSQ
jgi:hypothetical protein